MSFHRLIGVLVVFACLLSDGVFGRVENVHEKVRKVKYEDFDR